MKKLVSLITIIISTLSLPQEFDLDQNTIALWHFNENSGNIAYDESSNQAHGTLVGNPQRLEGNFGGGILLDGVDDYLSFQNDSIFNFYRSSFSIEFWIKIISNNSNNENIIVSKKNDITNGYGFIIYLDINNKLNARLTDDHGIGQPLLGPILDMNKWYNIAFVRDSVSGTFSFYIDGSQVVEELDPTFNIQSTTPFYIGRSGKEQGWESSCINAIVDEIRISNIARASNNIGELYDLFPLARWNKFDYNYEYSDTTYYVGSLEQIQNDSGIISYKLVDSTYSSNYVDWLVEQEINLTRHYITPEIDSIYLVEKTNYFTLKESLNGNHLLTSDPLTWDSSGYWGIIGIWKFPVYKPNNLIIPIYRFQDTSELFISNYYHSFLDSLWFDDRGLYKRTYYYEYLGNHQIYQHQKASLESLTGIIENQKFILPAEFHLVQNYPNPFNPSTKISWLSPVSSWQTLKVYDVLGNEVATLVNEYKQAGSYEIEFNPASSIKHPASGVYFYQLKAGDFVETKKMLLLK